MTYVDECFWERGGRNGNGIGCGYGFDVAIVLVSSHSEGKAFCSVGMAEEEDEELLDEDSSECSLPL